MTLSDREVLDGLAALGGRDVTSRALAHYLVRQRWPRETWWHRLRRAWALPVASLFTQLYRLERRGLVTSRWDPSMTVEELQARGGFRRRLYSLRSAA